MKTAIVLLMLSLACALLAMWDWEDQREAR